MKVETNYFGDIEVSENEVLTLDEGMIGFEEYKKFVLLREEDIFIEYLQSIQDKVVFAVMDPFLIKQDYKFEIPLSVCDELELKDPNDAVIKTVVIIPQDITKIRTNLQAPIVFNKQNNKGKQIILGDEYPIRYEFYNDGEEA